ncbi:MAG TPA: xylulokinase, partial [Acidimicrobiales bacterium]|nr:xylulokinase [Acidimicrobiales bacterium]
IDSSTQSTKVEVRDADTGDLVASGRARHPLTSPPRSEQDPNAWWRAFQAAWAEAGAPEVAALSVAGQQHGMVATDEYGEPVRPAKLWNDTETAPDASWLIKKVGGPELWAAAVGTVPVASLTITKLSWLHRTEADAWSRMRHVCLPHDWLTWKLTGRLVTDRGDASGTGYWSPLEERYRFDLLEVVGPELDWPSMVPPVLGPSEAAGQWGDASGSPLVACGTGDNMAAALGTGLGAGEISVSLGTSGTAYAVSDNPTADPTGAVAGFADASGRYLPLVCTLNATKVTGAIAHVLGVDEERLSLLAMGAAPGANGVVILPWFDGERTPNRPDATGMITGLRSDVSRDELARAAFEGVVCGLLDGIDALDAAGVPVEGARIVLVGGGAHSPAYRRVLADLSGQTVVVPEDAEHVAKGACVQAAALLHGVDVAEIARAWRGAPVDELAPDPDVDRAAIREAYASLRDRA